MNELHEECGVFGVWSEQPSPLGNGSIAPCFYGTDIDSPDNLIANHHSIDEIAKIIGVDSLGYLSLENAARLGGGGVCMACFDGRYPTEVPKHGEKRRFEKKIHE